MFNSIKNLFIQAMIALGIISSPQVIPPQEITEPVPQVIIQEQNTLNVPEIKKEEKPVVNIQKTNDSKKEEVVTSKVEKVVEKIEPVISVEKVSGQCGNNNNKDLENIPTDKLCAQGNASSVIEDGDTYKWSCLGSGGGKDIKCSANKKRDGLCGSLANTIFGTNYDKEKLCLVGVASGISYIDNQSKWSCSGSYGGENTICYGIKAKTQSTSINTQISTEQVKDNRINGSCGSAKYTQYGISKYDLCSTGTATPLVYNSSGDKYTWLCNGKDGGTSSYCSSTYTCLNDSGIYIYGTTKIPCKK